MQSKIDFNEEENEMNNIYDSHGGHNPPKKVACGASDLLDESKEDRLINKAYIKYMKRGGATIYDCTVSNGKNQRDVLEKICTKCNQFASQLSISFHLNSGRNDHQGDKKMGGFEIMATDFSGIKGDIAKRIVKNMKKLGISPHGDPYKQTKNLYYLNHTKAKAILLEVCFVDDKDDYLWYKSVGADAIGKAVAEAVLNKKIKTSDIDKIKIAVTKKAKVKISANAKYGGSANGKIIPNQYVNKRYTVIKVQKNNNQQEALIKELNSWVPTKYLLIAK